MNGIEWALAHGMDVAVVQLPDGDDPDSFVRREGGPALERLIDEAVPIGAWRFGRVQDALGADPSAEARSIAVKALLETVRVIADPVLHRHYRRQLAKLGNVDEVTIGRMLGERVFQARRTGQGAGGVSIEYDETGQ